MWKRRSGRASARSKTSYDIITDSRRKNPRTKIPETAIPEPYLLTETGNMIVDDMFKLSNKHGLTSLQSFYLLEWLDGIIEMGQRIAWKERTTARKKDDVVRAYLALNAHHRHNTPPNTILATTAVMLPTIHSINASYKNMVCASYVKQTLYFCINSY